MLNLSKMESNTQLKNAIAVATDTFVAARIERPGVIGYITEQVPPMLPHQLLVKMQGCGLCASNIPLWQGREWFSYPSPAGKPGHEGWGTVEAKGELVTDFLLGDRVTILHGSSFAEYAVVDQEDAIKLPSDLSHLPFPGEALSCLMNIFDRADIRPGQTVAVLGLGFIGLGLLQLLAHHPVRTVAVSRREYPLGQAEGLADHPIRNIDQYQTVQQINDLTDGRGCDRVIECTGHQGPLDIATAIIAEYGKLIIAGYHQDGLRQIDLQKWNWKAIDVINAHERDPNRYRKGTADAVEAVRAGQLSPELLVSHAYPFERLQEAMQQLTKTPEGLIKSYVYFS